jgi:hypothetical protein
MLFLVEISRGLVPQLRTVLETSVNLWILNLNGKQSVRWFYVKKDKLWHFQCISTSSAVMIDALFSIAFRYLVYTVR